MSSIRTTPGYPGADTRQAMLRHARRLAASTGHRLVQDPELLETGDWYVERADTERPLYEILAHDADYPPLRSHTGQPLAPMTSRELAAACELAVAALSLVADRQQGDSPSAATDEPQEPILGASRPTDREVILGTWDPTA